ncbi:MAG: aminoglycoside phosphotransferase family protein [Woeseia sp.]
MTPELIKNLLVQAGIADPDEVPVIEPLTGGVSSGIFKVVVHSGTYCVKQALPKLKVEKDWTVPTNRVFSEIAWLQEAAGIVPGHVPRVIAVNEQARAFVMQFLDEKVNRNWKALLMEGAVEEGAGQKIASVVGRIHEATASRPDVRKRFQNSANFYLLRLESYLIEAASSNPDLSRELIDLVHSVQHHPLVLVHGDVSPKNIFLGANDAILLDAECACFSDPAFDVAFLLNHLLLKSVYRPKFRSGFLQLLQEIHDEYMTYVTWEPKGILEARIARLLPGLMLARVDGKSPVEYLSTKQRSTVRKVARKLLVQPKPTLSQITDEWESSLMDRSILEVPAAD